MQIGLSRDGIAFIIEWSRMDEQFSASELNRVAEFGAQHNTAVLTLFFTDLHNSTDLYEKAGDRQANEVRQKHHSELRTIIEEQQAGAFIKSGGDSIFAVFSEPSRAVERALMIQRRLREKAPPIPSLPFRLRERIGIHMGQVIVEQAVGKDVFGRHVNRASRIMHAVPPEHIYASHSVWDSASGWTPGTVRWNSLGEFQLKGIEYPERLWEVYDPGITVPAAPLDAVAQPNAKAATGSDGPKPVALIVDRDSFPRTVLTAALERRAIIVRATQTELSSYAELVAQPIPHMIWINPEVCENSRAFCEYVSTVRRRWPSVVFILFTDFELWSSFKITLPSDWQHRISHYFCLNRNARLENFEQQVSACLDGVVRYDLRASGIELDL